MLKVLVGYPERDEELTVVNRSLEKAAEVRQVLPLDDLRGLQAAALDVYVDPSIVSYAVTIDRSQLQRGGFGAAAGAASAEAAASTAAVGSRYRPTRRHCRRSRSRPAASRSPQRPPAASA